MKRKSCIVFVQIYSSFSEENSRRRCRSVDEVVGSQTGSVRLSGASESDDYADVAVFSSVRSCEWNGCGFRHGGRRFGALDQD